MVKQVPCSQENFESFTVENVLAADSPLVTCYIEEKFPFPCLCFIFTIKGFAFSQIWHLLGWSSPPSHFLFIWYTLIDNHMLNQTCIPGIIPILLCYAILFLCHKIPFARLLKMFACIFLWPTVFLLMSLLSLLSG